VRKERKRLKPGERLVMLQPKPQEGDSKSPSPRLLGHVLPFPLRLAAER
jgi:hypothetical protein